MKLSVVDLSPVPADGTQADALRQSIDLAQHLEKWGYSRVWLAEHHGTAALAAHAPEVLIAVIAGNTRRIRVGSGAVLLNHYSPFKVAEQFRTLHAAFPGRIDLGVGRAYAGPVADVALQRLRGMQVPDDHGQQVAELMAWVAQEMPADHPFSQVTVVPDVPGRPDFWLLGSSRASPRLAAHLGLPYTFAGFIAPQNAVAALSTYRSLFQPSQSACGVQAPRPMLAMHVVCGDTQAEAERLAMTVRSMYARLQRGQFDRRLATPAEAVAEFGRVVPAEHSPWPQFVIGDPPRVKAELERMAAETGAEEIMIQDMIVDHAGRLRSYELLAEAFGLIA